MKRIFGLGALLALSIAIVPMAGHADDCNSTPAARVCTSSTTVVVDGNPGNPSITEGWLKVSTSGHACVGGGQYDAPTAHCSYGI